jgi:hypothetical protein
MSTWRPKYGLLLLFLPLVAAAACDRTELTLTGPAPSALLPLQSSFSAEPRSILPEFLPTGSCVTRPAFGLRLSVIIGGGEVVILRGLRFGFNDRFGASAFPDVFPIASLSAPPVQSPGIPTSSPISLPGIAALPASPIPIPGSSPIDGILIAAGTSRTLPFFLRFGCGLVPDGTLVITADAADANGRFETPQMRVRVGS